MKTINLTKLIIGAAAFSLGSCLWASSLTSNSSKSQEDNDQKLIKVSINLYGHKARKDIRGDRQSARQNKRGVRQDFRRVNSTYRQKNIQKNRGNRQSTIEDDIRTTLDN